MGRGQGWAKLPFTSLNGERGALYLRYGRRKISGLPASASVFASLGFLEAATTSPLQALPEASEQGEKCFVVLKDWMFPLNDACRTPESVLAKVF